MAKEDVLDMPASPPRTRKALTLVPDVWIARWLADPSLVASDRRRLEALRESRRDRAPERVVGLLIGSEGLTPEQWGVLRSQLLAVGATGVRHAGVAGSVHALCKRTAQTQRLGSLKEVVRESNLVIAAPKSPEPRTMNVYPVWEAVRYARHRKLPTKIVLPDGTLI